MQTSKERKKNPKTHVSTHGATWSHKLYPKPAHGCAALQAVDAETGWTTHLEIRGGSFTNSAVRQIPPLFYSAPPKGARPACWPADASLTPGVARRIKCRCDSLCVPPRRTVWSHLDGSEHLNVSRHRVTLPPRSGIDQPLEQAVSGRACVCVRAFLPPSLSLSHEVTHRFTCTSRTSVRFKTPPWRHPLAQLGRFAICLFGMWAVRSARGFMRRGG